MKPTRYVPAIDRFWLQTDRSGGESSCWVWRGGCNSDGYGCFRVNRIKTQSHRYAYEQFVGHIPEGMCVCHRCDNVKCVNPSHLFLGTQKDNMRDCATKGRLGIPLRLTPSMVLEIRARYSGPTRGKRGRKGTNTQAAIASEYGVAREVVKEVVAGNTWAWVQG